MPACESATGCGWKTASCSVTDDGMSVVSVRRVLHKASMKTRPNETPYLLLLIGVGAVLLVGTSAVAAVMAWMSTAGAVAGVVASDKLLYKLPTPPAVPAGAVAQFPPARVEGEGRVRVECAECSVVESTRQSGQLGRGIDPGAAGGLTSGGRNVALGKSIQSHEVTARMNDGLGRVVMGANSANWRTEERMTIIESTSQSKD
jgi:hypothetical protein